nr:hypothetical protein [uncultured Allomuricauda sp.]
MIKGRIKAEVNVANVCKAKVSEKISIINPSKKAVRRKTALFPFMGNQYRKMT